MKLLIRNIGLSLLAALISVTALAQYHEENGALEQIYELKARQALNTFLRPAEYSIVVAADINRDEKQLKSLEDEMDKMSLPGLPGMSLPESMNASNKLHDLKNRISVHLLLDDKVPKEKEDAAKTTLQTKLHLDESSGDTLVVSRAVLIPVDPKSESPEVLPELSWRMWMLVIMLSLLTLAGIFMATQAYLKKRKDDQASNKLPEPLEATPEEKEADAKLDEQMAEQKPLPDYDREMIELYERKKSLVELAGKYPEAATQGFEELFEKGQQNEVLMVCQELGWESAKALFSGASHRIWVKLGNMLSAQTKAPDRKTQIASFDLLHRSVVAKFLEQTDGDMENPFAFLVKMSTEDQRKLLNKQPPQNIAAICAFLNPSQKSDLLTSLGDDLQQAVLIQIGRMKEVPHAALKAVAEDLKQRLAFMKENPALNFDGQRYLRELLGQLNVLSENRFLERFARENETEYNTLRKSYLIFDDLKFVPQDIIAEAASSMDLSLLTQALVQSDPDVTFHILKSLPEKRAKMIEKDLSYIKTVSFTDVLAARRILRKSVQSAMSLVGQEPGSYLNQASPEEGMAQAA